MNYGNGFFYLAEIGDFRLAQNGCFHLALTFLVIKKANLGNKTIWTRNKNCFCDVIVSHWNIILFIAPLKMHTIDSSQP